MEDPIFTMGRKRRETDIWGYVKQRLWHTLYVLFTSSKLMWKGFFQNCVKVSQHIASCLPTFPNECIFVPLFKPFLWIFLTKLPISVIYNLRWHLFEPWTSSFTKCMQKHDRKLLQQMTWESTLLDIYIERWGNLRRVCVLLSDPLPCINRKKELSL